MPTYPRQTKKEFDRQLGVLLEYYKRDRAEKEFRKKSSPQSFHHWIEKVDL